MDVLTYLLSTVFCAGFLLFPRGAFRLLLADIFGRTLHVLDFIFPQPQEQVDDTVTSRIQTYPHLLHQPVLRHLDRQFLATRSQISSEESCVACPMMVSSLG